MGLGSIFVSTKNGTMYTITTESGKILRFSKTTYETKSLFANAFFQYLDASKEQRNKLEKYLVDNIAKHYRAISNIGMGMPETHVNAAKNTLRAIRMYNNGLIYKNN